MRVLQKNSKAIPLGFSSDPVSKTLAFWGCVGVWFSRFNGQPKTRGGITTI
jgi:hypothetical protein